VLQGTPAAALNEDGTWADVGVPASVADPQPTPIATSLVTASLSLPEDAAWEGWVGPAQCGLISCATEWHHKLVIGGGFHVVAHQLSSIALWDGTHFQSILAGGSATALGVWNDQLIAAVFRIRSWPNCDVLRWNGATWDTLGTANQQVNAISTHGSALVVAGQFSAVSGTALGSIAAFDGSKWSTFGAGLPGATVYSLTEHQGQLVASGFIFSLNNIAHWNEGLGVWQGFGPGLVSGVWSVVSDSVSLFASGAFFHSGSASVGGLARWDGTQWNQVGPFPSSGAYQTAPMVRWNGGIVCRRNPIVPGISRLAFWDGSQLAAMSDSIAFGTPNGISVLGTWGTKLVVIGGYVNNGSQPAQNLVLYDGTTWTTIGDPWDASMRSTTNGETQDMFVWNGQLVVGSAGGIAADFDHLVRVHGMGLFDGTHWSAPPQTLRAYYRVFGTFQSDLIAVGSGVSVDGTSITQVARWNGTAWSGFGPNGPDYGTGVQEYHGGIYIAHEPSYPPNSYAGLAHWNGSSWETVGGGLTDAGQDGYGEAVTLLGDSLIVAGFFDHAGGLPVANIAAWDGTAWHPLGAGFNGWVGSLVAWNGQLVAGGGFTASGPDSMAGAAVWDGTRWHAMGTNAVAIDKLLASNGALFASGLFRLPDNSRTYTVAHWTGTEWHVLGSGSAGYSTSFAVYGDYLYEAVDAGIVHGQLTHGIVRMPLSAELAVLGPPMTGPVALSASPNPGRGGCELTFSLPTAGRVRLEVLDVGGRVVTTLVECPVDAGRHSVRWTAAVPPGIYFARLESPSGRQAARIARLN
jgi:hypothetical protein